MEINADLYFKVTRDFVKEEFSVNEKDKRIRLVCFKHAVLRAVSGQNIEPLIDFDSSHYPCDDCNGVKSVTP